MNVSPRWGAEANAAGGYALFAAKPLTTTVESALTKPIALVSASKTSGTRRNSVRAAGARDKGNCGRKTGMLSICQVGVTFSGC